MFGSIEERLGIRVAMCLGGSGDSSPSGGAKTRYENRTGQSYPGSNSDGVNRAAKTDRLQPSSMTATETVSHVVQNMDITGSVNISKNPSASISGGFGSCASCHDPAR